ncbi:RNA methyltransferase [Weeksellaceae bacterium KMM 9713]|uniref:RNA methyltransferase n=1 Tax=Profundicola chukchiensis TaxID=2961959 RepID=A0A9X4MZW4_9FLAO|nr:RNA methyltransferase [Profundicola chukchiensis]MDG4946777.1 RNA methyltransferase [Profundicola chukchiensis]
MQQKKYRKELGLFVVEGRKSTDEFLASDFKLIHLFVSTDYKEMYPQADIASSAEFKQMSNLRTPPEILAVFEQKSYDLPTEINKSYFALDNVKDPGNLGTIIRIADWFGMEYVFCNLDTVEVYNPKVVQACMGSLGRIQVHYVDFETYFKELDCEIYGTFMEGDSIYSTKLTKPGLIVMGNESNGISAQIEELCTQKISIPQETNRPTESLNVAVASAMISSEIFRQKLTS